MQLQVRQLIRWLNEKPDAQAGQANKDQDSFEQKYRDVDRVLYLDPAIDLSWLIRIVGTSAHPRMIPYAHLQSCLTAKLAIILDEEPFPTVYLSDEQLSSGARGKRDEIYKDILPLVENFNPDLFESAIRIARVQKLAAEIGRDPKTINRRLLRFWQRGQVPNAVLPDYYLCGGKGEERKITDSDKHAKRGRRSAAATVQQMPGVNVDEKMKKKLQRGYDRYYLKRKKRSLEAAFVRTLSTEFQVAVKKNDKGVPVPILPLPQDAPTFDQFRYWGEKLTDPVEKFTAREGDNAFQLKHRPLLGSSFEMAYSPGRVYFMDSTELPVYTVRRSNRSAVAGKPVLYFAWDGATGLCAGFNVGYEPASYLPAILCLDNAFGDKVAFCSQYGITIEPHMWPCIGLPSEIYTDNAELLQKRSDHLAHGLGITLQNVKGYRGDLKGIVEQSFNGLKQTLLDELPGAVSKHQQPGDRDPRLEAVLPEDDLIELILYTILEHNAYHLINNYPFSKQMLVDGVLPIPLALWQWGIRNRAGVLRTAPTDWIRVNLLPGDEASVTREGIGYRGLIYQYPADDIERVLGTAGIRGSQPIDIAWDPRKIAMIYLRPKTIGQPILRCPLKSRFAGFSDFTWAEWNEYRQQQRASFPELKRQQRQSRAELNARADQKVVEAKAAQKATSPGKLSKKERRENIAENRALERTEDQHADAWDNLGELVVESEDQSENMKRPIETTIAQAIADRRLEMLQREREKRNQPKPEE